jgi:hypothetical protein
MIICVRFEYFLKTSFFLDDKISSVRDTELFEQWNFSFVKVTV